MIAKKGKTNYNKVMKIKKTTKKTIKKKDTKGKSEKPWVKVLDMNVSPDNPRNGFFELDWNDEFVNNLKQHGYLGKTDEEIVGIRPGEKVNEVLINKDEMKYCWEYQDMYLITNPSVRRFISSTNEFPGKKKIESMEVYSSDAVEKIPKEELKKIFTDLGLID